MTPRGKSSGGIDLGDFEPPAVPEAQSSAIRRWRSRLASPGLFRRVSVRVVATLVVIGFALAGAGLVGVVRWATSADAVDDGSRGGAGETPVEVPAEGAAGSDGGYAGRFGPLSEFTVSSTGTETVQLSQPLQGFLVRARFGGTGTTEVTFLDGAQKKGADGPSARGDYDGIRLIGGTAAETIAAVSVTQSSPGPWTLSFAPVSSAPVLASRVSGDGDTVLLYDGPQRSFTFSHGAGASIDQIGGRQQIGLEQLDEQTTRVTLRTGESAVTVLAAGADWTLIAD